MQLRVGETVKRRESRVHQIRDILVSISLCRAASAGSLPADSAGNSVFLTSVHRRRRRIGFNAWFTNGRGGLFDALPFPEDTRLASPHTCRSTDIRRATVELA